MKVLLRLYGIVAILFLMLTFFADASFLPTPQRKHLLFPAEGEVFHSLVPVLKTGSRPVLPEAEIIFTQPYLFAPGVTLTELSLKDRNLSRAHFAFADLRGTDLRGTNFSQAILYGARLEGAKFNSNTQLPFSKSFALKKGMIEVP